MVANDVFCKRLSARNASQIVVKDDLNLQTNWLKWCKSTYCNDKDIFGVYLNDASAEMRILGDKDQVNKFSCGVNDNNKKGGVYSSKFEVVYDNVLKYKS